MTIEITVNITQAVAPATAETVATTLHGLLHQLHAAGGIYPGDVLAVAGKRFRIAGRTWFLNEDQPALELTLTQL